MARARNIKPGFFTNDVLAEVEPLGRLLFAGLWTLADRCGRLEDRPKKIKAQILPYDNCNMDSLLNALADKQFIIRYEQDGNAFIQILNFNKHQNPHVKEPASTIPAPCLHGAGTSGEKDEPGINPADSLNLIPDSLNLIPDPRTAPPPRAGAGEPDEPEEPDTRPPVPLIPTKVSHWVTFMQRRGWTRDKAYTTKAVAMYDRWLIRGVGVQLVAQACDIAEGKKGGVENVGGPSYYEPFVDELERELARPAGARNKPGKNKRGMPHLSTTCKERDYEAGATDLTQLEYYHDYVGEGKNDQP